MMNKPKNKVIHGWRRFGLRRLEFICMIHADCFIRRNWEWLVFKEALCPKCFQRFTILEYQQNEQKLLCHTCGEHEFTPEEQHFIEQANALKDALPEDRDTKLVQSRLRMLVPETKPEPEPEPETKSEAKPEEPKFKLRTKKLAQDLDDEWKEAQIIQEKYARRDVEKILRGLNLKERKSESNV